MQPVVTNGLFQPRDRTQGHHRSRGGFQDQAGEIAAALTLVFPVADQDAAVVVHRIRMEKGLGFRAVDGEKSLTDDIAHPQAEPRGLFLVHLQTPPFHPVHLIQVIAVQSPRLGAGDIHQTGTESVGLLPVRGAHQDFNRSTGSRHRCGRNGLNEEDVQFGDFGERLFPDSALDVPHAVFPLHPGDGEIHNKGRLIGAVHLVPGEVLPPHGRFSHHHLDIHHAFLLQGDLGYTLGDFQHASGRDIGGRANEPDPDRSVGQGHLFLFQCVEESHAEIDGDPRQGHHNPGMVQAPPDDAQEDALEVEERGQKNPADQEAQDARRGGVNTDLILNPHPSHCFLILLRSRSSLEQVGDHQGSEGEAEHQGGQHGHDHGGGHAAEP